MERKVADVRTRTIPVVVGAVGAMRRVVGIQTPLLGRLQRGRRRPTPTSQHVGLNSEDRANGKVNESKRLYSDGSAVHMAYLCPK